METDEAEEINQAGQNNNATIGQSEHEKRDGNQSKRNFAQGHSSAKRGNYEVKSQQNGKRKKIDKDEKQELIGEAVGKAVDRMQQIMDQSGFSEAASLIKQHFSGKKKGQERGRNDTFICNETNDMPNIPHSGSEITIYRNAVQDLTQGSVIMTDQSKRDSSSSEKMINTSDEGIEVGNTTEKAIVDFIVENRPVEQAEKDCERITAQQGNNFEEGEIRPGTLRGDDDREEDQAENLIREAERSKVKMFQTPGRENLKIDVNNNFVHSAMVDEDYLVLGANIDDATKVKIERGEFVDLAKLLPCDRLVQEQDQ